MSNSALNIATLVGSRICHDLISPVGAINNGIELISMGGPIDTPELSLISDSVSNAADRIKFFRIAFGAVSGEQMMGASEIGRIAADAASGGRHAVDWQIEGDLPRLEVQALFLAILCIETALPRGGTIHLTRQDDGYGIAGSGHRVACDAALWVPLSEGRSPDVLRPAHVQFALLVLALQELGRSHALSHSTERVRLTF